MKISSGENDLPASASYDERVQYKNNFPAGIIDYRTLDFWYDDMLYGRINTNGDTIYPSEAFLKQLRGDGKETHFTLNFVADAYQSFRNDMEQQEIQGQFVDLEGTPFEDRFQPLRGWKNTNQDYGEYTKNYYDNSVMPFISDPQVADEIRDFDDFIEVFTRMIDITSLHTPFTKTEYITCKYASPLSSGLAVEFSDAAHGDDFTKITDFINNINFELYRHIARQHGFAIDKNAPWRMIANVGSDRMQAFMKNYDIDLKNLFKNYYYESHFIDIPTMKVYLLQFYEYFIQSFPEIRVPVIKNVRGANINLTEVIPRARMSPEEYQGKYDNFFWIRFYIYVRAKETNRDWDQYKFDQTVKRATDFYVYSGERTAFRFINKEVKREPGEFSQTEDFRKGTFRFKRKRE